MKKNLYEQYNFQQNVELDANLILAGMKGGMDGYINACLLRRNIFSDKNSALARAVWLKDQGNEYIKKVSKRTAELDKLLNIIGNNTNENFIQN